MNAIILFDGECNLCDKSVHWIIKRDTYSYFQFASLNSKKGRDLIQRYQIKEDSMVLVEKNKYYTKSGAALRVCKNLAGMWKFLYVLLIIPFPIRDLVYSILAGNRYKWFGKKISCMLPTPELKKRFYE